METEIQMATTPTRRRRKSGGKSPRRALQDALSSPGTLQKLLEDRRFVRAFVQQLGCTSEFHALLELHTGGVLGTEAIMECIAQGKLGIFPLWIPGSHQDDRLGKVLEDPWDNESYTVRLGPTLWTVPQGINIDTHEEEISVVYQKHGQKTTYKAGEKFDIPPQTTVVGELMEILWLPGPNGVCVDFQGLSRLARAQLLVHITAPFFHNGDGHEVIAWEEHPFAFLTDGPVNEFTEAIDQLWQEAIRGGQRLVGSRKTVELHNLSRSNILTMTVGQQIGQIRVTPVKGKSNGRAGRFGRNRRAIGHSLEESKANNGGHGRR